MKDQEKHPHDKPADPAPPSQEASPMEQHEAPVQKEPAPPLPDRDPQCLAQQIQALQAERDEVFARLQRLSADYSNYQKRVHRQMADAVAHEKETILRTLLPICDNFEMVLKNASSGDSAETILAGVGIVYDQILEVLKGHSVEPIKALDQPFDPVLHQALMQRSDPEKQDNWVLDECQKGYTLAGRVLRPSRVIVNRAPASPKSEQAQPGVAETSDEDAPDVE